MKRFFCLTIFVLFSLTSLAACQPTPETPPVVSKNDGTLENAIRKGASDDYIYTAPQSYSKSESFLGGKINVSIGANTNIVTKENIQYPVYEATVMDFEPATVKKIAERFFGTAGMEMHIDQEARQTKSYLLNNYILPLQERIANIENGTLDPTVDENGNTIIQADGLPLTVEDELDSLKEALSFAQKKYESAPESVETTPVTIDYYKVGDTFNADIPMSDGYLGRICIKDSVLTATTNYQEVYDTEINDYYGGVSGSVGLVEINTDILNEYTYSGVKYIYRIDSTLDYENAKTQAEDFVEALGIQGYSCVGVGIGPYSNVIETKTYNETTYTKYGVLFMRSVGDSICIPDSYEKASLQDGDIQPPFYYERLVVWVDANGVSGLYWSAPLKFERELQSSVELMEFDRIGQIITDAVQRTCFENAIPNSMDSTEFANLIILNDFAVTDIELGYAMMKEKNKEGYFILIPAWFISYDAHLEYTYEEEPLDYHANRALAINAVDGSIINRDVGY